MLDKKLLELGYSDIDIIRFKYDKELSKYTDEEKCKKIDLIFNHLLSLGYSREDIMKMTMLVPFIYSLSVLDIDNRYNMLLGLGYSDIDTIKLIKDNAKILIISDNQINEVIRILTDLGYSHEDIIKLTLSYSSIFNNIEEIKNKYNYLLSFGFDNKSINNITMKIPGLYGYKYAEFCEKINYLKEIGFSFEIVLKLSRECEFFSYVALDEIKNKIRDLLTLGFTIVDLDKMIYMYPNMLIFSTNDIIDRLQFLISLGYVYSYALTMIRENSLILSYSKEMIQMKIDLFYEYDYSFFDIKNMTVNCPRIYNIPMEQLILKLEFLKMARLSKIIIDNPSNLLFPISNMYSRYVYLKSIGKGIGYKSYNVLFISDDDFSKEYNVNMDEVLVNFNNNGLIRNYMKRKIRKKSN